MGIVDKLDAELPSAHYSARECFGSGRNKLYLRSDVFCMLSRQGTDIYCPLQSTKKKGDNLAFCLYDSYVEELMSRREK
ncbi:hypothetical protein KY349_02410 [Candidatus Woesearchaeota archaeon]|nr:hypothetical protein [Candidatus Woesearchaeota archaeon]